MSGDVEEARSAAASDNKQVRRAAASGWIGSALEYYDFSLYAQAAALVFPVVFFPAGNPTLALIASLGTYAVGYVARPIGAVVLGAWGDRKGRKNVLIFAMFIMGASTISVGLLPTYSQVGILSPILLVILRLIQGFAVAGELGGASAMIVEHAPADKRGFFASFALQGTQFGSVLAIAALLPLASFLPEDAWVSWGWRVPFLLSVLVIIAGVIIRSKVQEPEVFKSQRAQIAKAADKGRAPVVELLTKHPKIVLLCIIMTFANVLGMVTSTFGTSYATNPKYGNNFAASDLLWLNLFANVCAILTIPLFGKLSDRIGRKPFMVGGVFAGGISAWLFLYFVEQHNLFMMFVAVFFIWGFCFQMWNATFATFYQEQFPTRIRVTGFAISQNIGLMIASFFPSIFATIAPPGTANVPLIIGVLAFVIAMLSVVATLLCKETKGRSLADIDAKNA